MDPVADLPELPSVDEPAPSVAYDAAPGAVSKKPSFAAFRSRARSIGKVQVAAKRARASANRVVTIHGARVMLTADGDDDDDERDARGARVAPKDDAAAAAAASALAAERKKIIASKLKSSALAKGKLAVALNQAADDAGFVVERAKTSRDLLGGGDGAKAGGPAELIEKIPLKGIAKLGEHLRHPPLLRPSDRMPWDLLLCGFMAYIIISAPYRLCFGAEATGARARARFACSRARVTHTHTQHTLYLRRQLLENAHA